MAIETRPDCSGPSLPDTVQAKPTIVEKVHKFGWKGRLRPIKWVKAVYFFVSEMQKCIYSKCLWRQSTPIFNFPMDFK